MMMNGKGFGSKQSWPNLRYYARIRLERLRTTRKNTINTAGRQGRDLNPGPPEYEVGMLIALPRHSVSDLESYKLTFSKLI
jgi:hypothetical protein